MQISRTRFGRPEELLEFGKSKNTKKIRKRFDILFFLIIVYGKSHWFSADHVASGEEPTQKTAQEENE